MDETTLLARLKKRDNNDPTANWLEHYYSLKKRLYTPPTKSEADLLLTYTQNNYEQVLDELKQFLSS